MGQLRDLASQVRHRDTVLGEWGLDRGVQGHGRDRAVRRQLRDRQDAGRGGGLGTGARPVRDRPGHSGRQVHRRNQTTASSVKPTGSTACCSSTRPTPSSASAPRCRTPTTATRTSRSASCCSAWSASTASPSSPRTWANIDEAFLRRLDVLVDFPSPDEDLRLRLWERHLPGSLPAATTHCRPRVPGELVRPGRRQHPQHRSVRGVPGRRQRRAGDDGAPGAGHRPRVPQEKLRSPLRAQRVRAVACEWCSEARRCGWTQLGWSSTGLAGGPVSHSRSGSPLEGDDAVSRVPAQRPPRQSDRIAANAHSQP